MTGAWNPWNLVVVDRVLFHPILGGLMAAGALVGLCYLHIRPRWVRVLVVITVTCLASVWTLGWLALASFDRTEATVTAAVSSYNDVELGFRADDMGSASHVWLRPDRGLLSRENEVGTVWTDLSGAPLLDGRFTAPDALVVTTRGEAVYRVWFDPRNLEVRDVECLTLRIDAGGMFTSCTPGGD